MKGVPCPTAFKINYTPSVAAATALCHSLKRSFSDPEQEEIREYMNRL